MPLKRYVLLKNFMNVYYGNDMMLMEGARETELSCKLSSRVEKSYKFFF